MAAKTDLDDEAYRVAVLRRAARFATDAAFAERLGITPQRLGNVLKGSGLGKDLAMLMCRAVPGLTLDWLHRGRTEALTVDLLRRIEAAEAELAAELGRKGKTASPRGREAR